MKGFWTTTLTVAIAVLAMAAVLSSSASAEEIKAWGTRSANDSGSNTHFFKALNDNGATSLTFSTTVNNKLMKITYNAECGALGPVGSWVSITVLVDGIEANPRGGTDFAFCTASSNSSYRWVAAVRQSFIKVPFRGQHTVQIRVDLNGATSWWLGQTSISVEAA